MHKTPNPSRGCILSKKYFNQSAISSIAAYFDYISLTNLVRMRLFPVLLLIIAWPAMAQYTVDSVPNQKLIDGSYVTNPDSIISNETVVSINNTLRALEQNTTVQVAVVALKSIGEIDDFTFAQGLFELWKIGHADKDNGLLILLITDSRTIRLHTGRGLEGTLPDVVCKQIQRDWMLPDFKNANYDRGLRLGVYQVHLVLSNPDYADELKSRSNPIQPLYYGDFALYLLIIGIPLLIILFFVKDVHEQFVDSKKSKPVLYPELLIKQKTWFWVFVMVPGVIFLLSGLHRFVMRRSGASVSYTFILWEHWCGG